MNGVTHVDAHAQHQPVRSSEGLSCPWETTIQQNLQAESQDKLYSVFSSLASPSETCKMALQEETGSPKAQVFSVP